MIEIWHGFLNGMGAVLAFFYSIVPNYGVAIVLFTVTVRLVLFPLTAKGIRSMRAMQEIQPEIKKLQAKHKNDRQKLNEEMMKFYKENKVNPFGGCLPLIAQAPIFMALYQVLQNIRLRTPVDSELFRAVCGSRARASCEGHQQPLKFAWMDLSKRAADVSGIGKAMPYFILILLVMGSAYLQQKQSMSRSTAQPNAQMVMVGRIMPIFFGFISYSISSGVVLYFLTSNLWQIGQQDLIYRKLPPPGSSLKAGGVDKVSTTSGTSGGGMLSKLLKPPPPPASPPSDKVRPPTQDVPPRPQQPRRRNKKKRR